MSLVIVCDSKFLTKEGGFRHFIHKFVNILISSVTAFVKHVCDIFATLGDLVDEVALLLRPFQPQ